MADGDEAEPRYSAEEVALILERASDTGKRGTSIVLGDGYTLDDLAWAAQEAGLDPDAVRRAARLVTVPPDPVQRLFLGAPSHPRVRARYPGRLAEARVPEARDVIERTLERGGELHHDVTGFLWREDHGVGRTYVRVRREDGATSVEVEADRRGHLLALMVVLATLVALLLQPLGGFTGLAGVMGPLLSVVVPVATVLAATRTFWPWLARPTLRRAEATAMELGALVRPAPPSAGDGADALPPPPPEPASGDDAEAPPPDAAT